MNDVVLTVDVDWAPDFAIDFVAEQLIAHKVQATWFVTHLSPAIARLHRYPDLFELGIHPNFLPGSTDGETPEAVLSHCMELVPLATSMRSHALVQSTPLLHEVLTKTPITTDVSLFLPCAPNLEPVWYRRLGHSLLRIPYFWEDDFEMEQGTPCWDLTPYLRVGDGLKVFDFHAIHVYLNSTGVGPYRSLKQRVPRLAEVTPSQAAEFVQTGKGAQTLFLELIRHLSSVGQSMRICDVYKQFNERLAVI